MVEMIFIESQITNVTELFALLFGFFFIFRILHEYFHIFCIHFCILFLVEGGAFSFVAFVFVTLSIT